MLQTKTEMGMSRGMYSLHRHASPCSYSTHLRARKLKPRRRTQITAALLSSPSPVLSQNEFLQMIQQHAPLGWSISTLQIVQSPDPLLLQSATEDFMLLWPFPFCAELRLGNSLHGGCSILQSNLLHRHDGSFLSPFCPARHSLNRDRILCLLHTTYFELCVHAYKCVCKFG